MDHWYCSPFFIGKQENGLLDPAAPWTVNAPALPDAPPLDRMATLYTALADRLTDSLAAGHRPVSLAGDCLGSLPMLAALQRANIDATLLWLDAHGDFNIPDTSPSGFLGGMPLAMAVGRGWQTLPEALGMRPHAESRILLADARDLDPGEREAVAASAMTHLPEAAQLLDCPLPPGPLYIHFDTDLVRPEDSPAQNYLTPGGPSTELMHRICTRLARDADIRAISISAWNPTLPGAGASRNVSLALVAALLAPA